MQTEGDKRVKRAEEIGAAFQEKLDGLLREFDATITANYQGDSTHGMSRSIEIENREGALYWHLNLGAHYDPND